MKARILAGIALLASCAAAQNFDARKGIVLDQWAHPKSPGAPGYGTIAAKLAIREDPQWCSSRLEELLAAGPQGTCFGCTP